MAEFIQKTDTLNQGREKLNEAITDANKAKVDAGSAVNTSNQAKQIAQIAEDKADSVQAQFDQVVIEGDSSVEAAAARVDTENVSHPTLKARLDADNTKVTAQLAETANEIIKRSDDVKRHGAVGNANYLNSSDGLWYENQALTIVANDDRVPINNALEQGGNIYIPKGRYMVNAALEIRPKSNTNIIFHPEAILTMKGISLGKYNIINLTEVENVSISGGTIIGDRDFHQDTTGEWGMGIGIYGAKNITIRDMVIKNCWGDGIYVSKSTNDIISENIKVINNVCDNNRRQGLSVTFCKNVLITGNLFSNTNGANPQAGVDIEPNAGEYIADVKIINNIFLNNQYGLLLYGVNGEVKDVLIDGNTFENNTREGINVNKVKGTTIINNVIKGNRRYGVFLSNSEDTLLKSNIIKNNTTHGVYLSGSNYNKLISNRLNSHELQGVLLQNSSDNFISGNEVFENNIGIQLLNGNSRNTISGNRVWGNYRQGISLTDSHNNYIDSNFLISNGQLSNVSYHNITINSSDYNFIQGNIARKNNAPNQPSRSLHIFSAAKFNLVRSNDFINSSGTSAILDEGVDNTLEGNRV